MEEKKIRIIQELCPNIVEISVSSLVSKLNYVLDSKFAIRRVGPEWFAQGEDCVVVFSEKPTREYLKRLVEQPADYLRHIMAVEDLQKRISAVASDCNPFRQVAIAKPDPLCKHCGNTDYIDCTTHYTCRICATVRTKIERGLDYRNIKARSQAQGDLNSSNYHTLNPLLSDGANRQTVVSVAPGENPADIRSLTVANKRMNKIEMSEADQQKIRAKEKIDDIRDDLALHAAVAKKAFGLFCKFVCSQEKLPRENEIIAACLFEALPDKPKIYPKRKKRSSEVPYNDSKQKRLRFTSFSKR